MTASVHPTATRWSRPGAAHVIHRRDAPPVLRLTTLLRSILDGSLGNAGAVENVRSVLESRVRDDWVVEGLRSRLEPPAPAAAAETTAA